MFSGCYSFFQINADEFEDIKENDTIKITLENGEVFVKNNIRNINATDNQIEFVNKYSESSVFLQKKINIIAAERFDYPKTILTSLFMCFAAIGIFVLFGGSLSPGG